MILTQFHRDILHLIFGHIDFDSARNLRLVCKRFRDLITIEWIESNCLISVNDHWEEYSCFPNRMRHGESICYAHDLNSHNLVVTDIRSCRYGLVDGPQWKFRGEGYTSFAMYRQGYCHGIHAIWMPGYLDFWMESYFWGYRIPEGKIFHPDTDVYAYKSPTTRWVSIPDGAIIIQRMTPAIHNEYQVRTFNVKTQDSNVEYYDRKGNLTVRLEYDPKNNRSIYRSWHKNGQLKCTGQYRGGNVNNRRCGEWLCYARNGVLIKSTTYLEKGKTIWHRDTW